MQDPEGHYECVNACPEFIFNNSGVCTTSCEKYSYPNGTCTSTCSDYPYMILNDGMCTDSCDSGYIKKVDDTYVCRKGDCGDLLEYYDATVSTTMKLCTSVCPSGYT